MAYNPVVFFAAKDRVPSKVSVPFVKHYKGTFPKEYKTIQGAINFARRMIEEEEGVWQLPGCKRVEIP